MKTLRIVWPDQLSRPLSALRDMDPGHDLVLMAETEEELRYVPHHRQKLVLMLSAMRHFADGLRRKDVSVLHVPIEEECPSMTDAVARAVERGSIDTIVTTRPGEWRQWEAVRGWEERFGMPVEIREDDRFLCPLDEFRSWADGRKQLRMEYFYREMRRRTGWLMDGDRPEGGSWNYDKSNRKRLPDDARPPDALRFAPDAVTRSVMATVADRFDHFGDLDSFGWAVTREDALQALDYFVRHALHRFGDYQDAMRHGDTFLYHSVISPYLNIGLLGPREVCEDVLRAYDRGAAPLNAVEGFVRQILGWREYVRGIYWTQMPGYAATNHFDARRSLPEFYWTGETEMNCMRQCIEGTHRHAYAHHIQRLMVTGNFALLAGLSPAEVEAWYLAVYADAFEWVELPNTHGMVLHADGGLLASKPYAASGSYINRMSDYCGHCRFDVREKTGDRACPFNYLYWYFLIANEDRLAANHRMGMPYRTLGRMSVERKEQIVRSANVFLDAL